MSAAMSSGRNVLTVGHGSRSAQRLVAIVANGGIATVVDVRSHPASRRYPWFGRAPLARALDDAGIGYLWLGRELGGRRRPTPGASRRHPALGSGMAAFADHMASAAFRSAIAQVLELAASGLPALMCAETDPRTCHRWLIADYLALVEGVTPCHLATPRRPREHHPPSPEARVSDATLRYDRGVSETLELGQRPGRPGGGG